ncbi:hypothetical protein LOAG_13080 [Loa loa]|uniref:Uncharacterized protein n=1 Tax=Loa loa TaxID=7209 RepID=A0A1S0TKJ5_LOALO|nr:hypothetical protein LOAG_13080 [Loa loa]EFO15430.1 hypothetical protein LOAG_13080 [Loa loa]
MTALKVDDKVVEAFRFSFQSNTIFVSRFSSFPITSKAEKGKISRFNKIAKSFSLFSTASSQTTGGPRELKYVPQRWLSGQWKASKAIHINLLIILYDILNKY